MVVLAAHAVQQDMRRYLAAPQQEGGGRAESPPPLGGNLGSPTVEKWLAVILGKLDRGTGPSTSSSGRAASPRERRAINSSDRPASRTQASGRESGRQASAGRNLQAGIWQAGIWQAGIWQASRTQYVTQARRQARRQSQGRPAKPADRSGGDVALQKAYGASGLPTLEKRPSTAPTPAG